MTVRPPDLPDFERPPVVETALSLQFDRLAKFHAAHFGLYWNGIRHRFPKTEERVELPPFNEFPSEPPAQNVSFQFQSFEVPPLPRVWFVNERETELIQVQRDRFVTNWRKTGDKQEYPRYETIREEFNRDFGEFRDFVTQQQLGEIRITQCEVTYVNHIVSGEVWQKHSEMDKVFTLWNQPNEVYPGSAQDLGFHARFPIQDSEGNLIGRLHANVRSVTRVPDGAPMFILDLTARGQIGDDLEFFEEGRRWIVKSFAALTTPEMHRVWGRRS